MRYKYVEIEIIIDKKKKEKIIIIGNVVIKSWGMQKEKNGNTPINNMERTINELGMQP